MGPGDPHAAYAFGVEPGGLLVHTYWGPCLPRFEDYPTAQRAGFVVFEDPAQNTPQEVTTGEAGDSNERTLDGVAADGHLRGFVLRVDRVDVVDDSIVARLCDRAQGIAVSLTYRVNAFGLFTRTLAVSNEGRAAVKLTRTFSGTFHLPGPGDYALNYFDGRWADEFGWQRKPVDVGTFARESRRLTTSHYSVPFLALDGAEGGRAATETTGALWFGTLEWSGNWKFIAERTRADRTMVHIGMNDHDFAWDLQAGETFEAPRIVFGYCAGGFGAMSRCCTTHLRRPGAAGGLRAPSFTTPGWRRPLPSMSPARSPWRRAASIGVELCRR